MEQPKTTTQQLPVHVFVTSDLGCEVGLASLARFLIGPQASCAVIPMSEIKKPSSFAKVLSANNPIKSLNLCGDFWESKEFTSLIGSSNLFGLDVYRYTFDGRVRGPKPLETGVSPSRFIISRAAAIIGENNLLKFAVMETAEVCSYLDDRCQSLNVAKTQPFFTGLHNVYPGPVNLEDRIFKLFTREIALSDVMKTGMTIVQSQIEVAHERALKNSRAGILKDGTTYAVTEGPEFCNITHDELHKYHANAQVTIVTSIKFKNGEDDLLAYSLRSWDSKVDVKSLVEKQGGGGSATSSGVRRAIDVHIDF